MSAIAKRTRSTLFIALYRRAGAVQLPSPVTFLMPARPNLCGLDHNSVSGHATNLAACPVRAAEGRSFWDLPPGGLVLTRTILLTAAHCVSNASDSRVYLPRRRLLPIRPDREVSRLSR